MYMNSLASVTSVYGNISISGTGYGNGNGNRGFLSGGGSLIESTGAANITITAIGSGGVVKSGQTGGNRNGFDTSNTSILSLGTGNITITGSTGSGDSGGRAARYGSIAGVGTLVASYGSGSISVYASSLNVGATAPFLVAGNNSLTIAPSTNSAGQLVAAMNLGTFSATGTNGTQNLSLSAANLSLFSAGTLNLGSSAVTGITVSGNIARSVATNVGLTAGAAGGTIAFNAGDSLNAAGGNVTLSTNNGAITAADNVTTEITGDGARSPAGTAAVGTGTNNLRVYANSVNTSGTSGTVSLTNLNSNGPVGPIAAPQLVGPQTISGSTTLTSSGAVVLNVTMQLPTTRSRYPAAAR